MFKSGFVSIVGRPNVGKSTLMNNVVGEKIAIMSDKPQTTRNTIQAVYTDEEAQVVFLDTPGIHKPKNKLGEFMVKSATDAFKNVDVILYVVDESKKIGPGDSMIIAGPTINTKIPVQIKPTIPPMISSALFARTSPIASVLPFPESTVKSPIFTIC